jgi:hypothetical protein
VRRTYTYVCGNGHLVKAENSAVNVDSLCRVCRRQAQEREWRQNPFYAGRAAFGGGPSYWIDVQSRLDRVRGFNTDQCHRALRVRGLQKTVRTAIERRLRKLQARG